MSKKGLRLATVFLLILSLVALAGCGSSGANAPAGNSNSAGSGEKVLKVGSDIAYAPFEFFDEKHEAQGFDIDLMKAIGEDLGYKVEFKTSSFDSLSMSLANGNFDAVISAMTITPERAKSILFSDKYFQTVQYIASKKGSNFKTIADLKGKRVGVQLDTTGQFVVEDQGITPKKYDTTPDALNDLLNGGVDAVVADAPVVIYFAEKNKNANIDTVKADVDPEFYGIAFKLGNTELANKVNATLKKFKEDGTYNNIYKKWFNEDAPKF